jgi:hypothetical protein
VRFYDENRVMSAVALALAAAVTVTVASKLLDALLSLSPVGRCRSLHQCSDPPRGSLSESRSSRAPPGCTQTDWRVSMAGRSLRCHRYSSSYLVVTPPDAAGEDGYGAFVLVIGFV